jgi:hypothetical protein
MAGILRSHSEGDKTGDGTGTKARSGDQGRRDPVQTPH